MSLQLHARSKLSWLAVPALTIASLFGGHSVAAPTSNEANGTGDAGCAALAGRTLAGAEVSKADHFPAGSKLAPFPAPLSGGICRIDARVSSGPGSLIKIQVWLPQKWNGKFVGIGGGGYSGGLASGGLELTRLAEKGYAAVATDAGHDVTVEAKWALGSPVKIADFAHRANHLGAVAGKAIATAYYGSSPKRSLFNGCSNGGRDALMLAQRYPADYDSIVAGAPANNWTGLMTWFASHEQVLIRNGGLSAAKVKLLHDAAIGMCDGLDGARDGLISQPRTCKFDPGVLECKSGGSSCLTPSEIKIARSFYADVRLKNGTIVQPGLPVGSEYQWPFWSTNPNTISGSFARQFYRYIVYSDPAWDIGGFDIDKDYPYALRNAGPVLDASNPDVRPFLKRGGRLLMYHGWDDAAIPAGNTLAYYSAMRRVTGRLGSERTRLFMLPGVGHCSGGNGPSLVDYLDVLDKWTENGVAPESVVAATSDNPFLYSLGLSNRVLASRPVCAWPRVAQYIGTGSVKEASSFVCR